MSKENDLGPCSFVLGKDTEGELICGHDATTEILVRNNFGLFLVPICSIHKRQHEAFYGRQRHRPRHRSISDLNNFMGPFGASPRSREIDIRDTNDSAVGYHPA